ncbi:exosome complex protein Rrp42 [Candidatus Woesearchaeota archaeon]|nr:exosome complex protein Rrp42 [Candidatus Woesearchaeota archaeon]
MSNLREHILKSLEQGIRFDGRKLDEIRVITVEKGISKNAEGSARVVVGDTEVMAGVKTAVEKPYPDTPDQGNLMVNAELLPLSNPDYESGPPSEEAIEVARIIDRGIREAKAIDLPKLCITPKEAVWSIMIDVLTINAHGSVIDAAALASVIALAHAKLPKYEDGAVKYDELASAVPLARKNLPITVTVYKIGSHLFVDPLPEEEEAADARLTAAVIEDGSIVALQKGGEKGISAAEVDAMLELAQKKAKELRKLL